MCDRGCVCVSLYSFVCLCVSLCLCVYADIFSGCVFMWVRIFLGVCVYVFKYVT